MKRALSIRKNLFILFFLLLVLSAGAQVNQTITLSGKVTDQHETPLTGVTIISSDDRASGTVTDIDGNFHITITRGRTLEFSYIGFETKTLQVDESQTLTVQLKESTTALSEVVITSLNIPREKKALGYAVQNVTSEAFQTRPTNPMSALAVKIA